MDPNVVIVLVATGPVDRATTGLAGAARALAANRGGSVTAVIVGPRAEEASRVVAPLVDRAIVGSHPDLGDYQPERYLQALQTMCRAVGAGTVLLGSDTYSQELTPRLARRLGGTAAADASHLELREDGVAVRRAVYGGKAEAVFLLRRLPAVVWIRARAFEAPVPRDHTAAVETIAAEPPSFVPTHVVERSVEAQGAARLEDAAIIVSGGRGVGGAEPFSLLRRLAEQLGAQMAASRAACDAGWVPASWQVGQTGKKVAPALYVAVAISGASQHMIGVSDAKVIAAINTDPDAAIFRHSRFGLVGDFRRVLPLLCERLAALQQ